MQDLLISVLKPKLVALPFISLFGGLAQTLSTTSTEGNAPVRMPISNEPGLLLQRGLNPDQYVSLAPDGNEAGVAYFEHRSLRANGIDRQLIKLTSVMRLVYWGKLGDDPSAPILATAALIKAIPEAMYTARPLSAVFHEVTAILLPQDGLFDKYTYTEAQTQHLMTPYTAFALEITTKFNVGLACMPVAGPQLDGQFSGSFGSSFL
jgi:hypothetical protein